MVLQLDNVDGNENFQPDWGRHVEVLRRYSPAIERWRGEVEANMPESLRRRSDAAQLVDKYLWTMSGENGSGDPTIFHDGGNGYGLMADRVSRTPPGSPPDVQIRNAWTLVANNPKTWTDWGEGSSYQGQRFGALGVIAPYDPDPSAVHPSQGGTSRISPPNVGEEGLASSTTMPQGWEPPAGYASSSNVPLVEKLRIAREKRLRDSGYIPPEDGTAAGAAIGGGFGLQLPGEGGPSGFAPGTTSGMGGGGNARPGDTSNQDRLLAPNRRLAEIALGGVADVFSAANKIPVSSFVPGGAAVEAASGLLGGPEGPKLGDKPAPGITEPLAHAIENVPSANLLGRAGIHSIAGVELPDAGSVLAAAVPQTYLDFGLNVAGAKGGVEALTGIPGLDDLGKALPKLYDEAAVRMAANTTFDRLAPPSLLRHERAGAAIAQEAAGVPVDPRSPFARSGTALQVDPSKQLNYTTEPLPRSAADARRGGAATGRDFGPEVAGGGTGRKAYGNKVRDEYVAARGIEQAAALDEYLAKSNQTWADYGDATRAMSSATPAHAVDPGTATVNTAFRGDPANPADVTREIRRSVADVRAEKAGTGTRAQMEAASARRGGARTGREAGSDVGGGSALGRPVEGAPGTPPPGVDSPAALLRLKSNVESMMREGAPGRFWYEESGQEALNAAQHDVPRATKLAVLFAFGSPREPVVKQGNSALKAWGQLLSGDPVAIHTTANNKRINSLLSMSDTELDGYVKELLKTPPTAAETRLGETPRGRKTGNFFLAMLEQIDPERAARIRSETTRAGVTVDMHMARAFGYGKDAVNDKEYTFIESVTQEISDKLGWTQHQGQAAVFTADIARDPTRKVSVQAAAANYADALKRNRSIVSWESAPGKGTPASARLPNFEHWSYPQMVEFHADAEKIFFDDNGNNMLVRALDLLGNDFHRGPGIYEGGLHPGASFDTYAHPTMYSRMDELAALTGYSMQQTAVPWTRPVSEARVGIHNGFVLDMGRPMTDQEALALNQSLGDAYVVVQAAGNNVYAFKAPQDIDFTVRGMDQGAAGYKDAYEALSKENKVARQKILDTMDEVWDGSLEVGHRSTAFDGNYLENDWTVAPNGETYLSAAPSAQRPDVREVLTTLRSRFQAVVEKHAALHAADPPIGARDPRFDYGALEPVSGLVARQRDITRTRGAAWVDPQGQIWQNKATEHVDAIITGRETGTRAAFNEVMPDGWVRVVSTKNPDHPLRELTIQGIGEDNLRAGADVMINSLPESARETTNLFLGQGEPVTDYWTGTAKEWLDQGKPVAQPDPFGRTAPATSLDSGRARLEGARVGREAGAEVGGGSALPPGDRPERPKTQWTITTKDGASRVVTTDVPVSGSVEEAQARFAANTQHAEDLSRQARNDQRLGRAQQGAEGVRQLRDNPNPVQPEDIAFGEPPPPGGPPSAQRGSGAAIQAWMQSHTDRLQSWDTERVRRTFRSINDMYEEDLARGRNAEELSGLTSSLREMGGELYRRTDGAEGISPGPSVADVRRSGAQQGRIFGDEVSGGRVTPPTGTGVPATNPASGPIADAIKGLGRELAATPGAALSTVASWSPQLGRQGLPAFFMNPRRTLRNLGTSLKAGTSEAEGVKILDATLADDWIRSTKGADAAAKAAYDAQAKNAGPVWLANNKPPAAGTAPRAGYTWQDVGGTILDWRGTGPLEGKTLAELTDIAAKNGLDLPKNVTAAAARERIARDLRPELLEGLSQDTKVGQAAEWITRPSSRQSAIELNLYRTDWYKGAAQHMWDAGERDVKQYEELRKTVEIFTQRGAWKQPFRVPAFFSTRAMSARVQMIGRGLDALAHFPEMAAPGARQEAGKALLALTAGNLTMMAGLYGAATALGLQPRIETDGKLPTLTVGDAFHFDPWAGINTPARAIFGVIADTMAAPSLADAPQAALASATTRGQKLLRGGLSPLFGKAADTATGRDFTGQKYSLKDDITSGGLLVDLLAPMTAASAAEGFREGGVGGAAATTGPSSLSFSVNAYMRPEDAANRASRDKYGRAYDDLTRDERLTVVGSLPEQHSKPLAKADRKAYESDRAAAGWQDYWTTDRKNEFFKANPGLETQAWFHERRTIQSVDTVDKVLALGIPDREVRFTGVPVDIARDDKTRAAWDKSKGMLEEYTHTIIEKNRATVAQRMYKKRWEDLNDSQQSSVVGNIHDSLLNADSDMKAWMYWWGKTKSLKGQTAIDTFRRLQRDFGPGADSQGIGGTLGKHLDTNYKGPVLGAAR